MIHEFRHLHMPPELACQFMAAFSRMEYALKSTNYANGNENKVDPAWDRFANEIDYAFRKIEDQEIVSARTYLLKSPPRKQALDGKKLVFVTQAIDNNQSQTQQLLLMVRIVRNNLFHGGKYLPEGELEAGRNHLLVRHSLNILRACSKLIPVVRSSYER